MKQFVGLRAERRHVLGVSRPQGPGVTVCAADCLLKGINIWGPCLPTRIRRLL